MLTSTVTFSIKVSLKSSNSLYDELNFAVLGWPNLLVKSKSAKLFVIYLLIGSVGDLTISIFVVFILFLPLVVDLSYKVCSLFFVGFKLNNTVSSGSTIILLLFFWLFTSILGTNLITSITLLLYNAPLFVKEWDTE